MYLIVELQLKDRITQEWKDKPQTGRKYLQKTSDKGLLTKIDKEFLKLNSKKTIWLKNVQKIWTDTSPKIYKWQISIWKDVPYYMSSGKCKLQQRDTTILLLEWPKTKTLRTVYTDKDGEQHEFSCIAGRNTKWYSHFGRQFACSLQN